MQAETREKETCAITAKCEVSDELEQVWWRQRLSWRSGLERCEPMDAPESGIQRVGCFWSEVGLRKGRPDFVQNFRRSALAPSLALAQLRARSADGQCSLAGRRVCHDMRASCAARLVRPIVSAHLLLPSTSPVVASVADVLSFRPPRLLTVMLCAPMRACAPDEVSGTPLLKLQKQNLPLGSTRFHRLLLGFCRCRLERLKQSKWHLSIHVDGRNKVGRGLCQSRFALCAVGSTACTSSFGV